MDDDVKKKSTPDQFDLKEDQAVIDAQQSFEIKKLELQLQKLRNELDRENSDTDLRQKYGRRILRFLEYYAGIVGAIIIIDAIECVPFNLDPTATVTLVGSTAVAAIGLVGFVAKGLFGK